jgi:hypothetical protein
MGGRRDPRSFRCGRPGSGSAPDGFGHGCLLGCRHLGGGMNGS